MNTIIAKEVLNEQEIKDLHGNFLNESHLTRPIIEEDTIVKNEKGDTVLIFLKNVIPNSICESAYQVLRKAVTVSNNRGQAAGPLPPELKTGDKIDHLTVGKITKNRFYPLRKDGTLSNSPKARSVYSSIIGYSDRYARIPYCRTTEYTRKNFEEYKKALPYIIYIGQLFKKYMPERYAKQKEYWEKTNNDFKIKDTPFTTITINKNFRTACHYDKGDLKEGFGILAVLQGGEYFGGYTILPKYGIGVNERSCDLSLFDVHELHGNTEIKTIGNAERISVVCYFREKMTQCGSAEEELERIKNK